MLPRRWEGLVAVKRWHEKFIMLPQTWFKYYFPGIHQAVSQSQRWKKKKAGVVEDPKEKENKEQMLKLTGIADEILTRWSRHPLSCFIWGFKKWFTRSGNMEIYEMTYEGILFKIKAEEEKKVCTMTRIIKFYNFCANWVNLKLKVGKKAAIPDNVDDDDALDMFADNLDGDAKKTEKVPVKDKEDPVLDDVSIFRHSKESHWNYVPREGELGVQVENRGCWTAWTSHQSKDAWLAGEWVSSNEVECYLFAGVRFLWCRHSCPKSWHWRVQGFQEDWFWALRLAILICTPFLGVENIIIILLR